MSFTYSLLNNAGGRFAIDSNSGAITIADDSLIDYETNTSHTISVRVTDNTGLTYDENFVISVTDIYENTAPTVANAIADYTVSSGVETTYTFASNTFSDAENNALFYTVTDGSGLEINESWFHFDSYTRTFTLDPTLAVENTSYTVIVTAHDGFSGTVSDTFDFNISANPSAIRLNDNDDLLKSTTGNDVLASFGGSDQINADEGHDTVYLGAGDDYVLGGLGNDALYGGMGNDILYGNEGHDTFYGGLGVDTVSYAYATAAVTVNLATNSNSIGNSSDIDSYDSIENLVGSNYDDQLTGDANDNHIEGGIGADTIDGLGGSDTLSYIGSASGVSVDLQANTFAGGDAQGDVVSNVEDLMGSTHIDTLTGDTQSNIIEGRGGADILDGGTGIDTLAYTNSASGVSINLTNASASGGDADGDTISNFENLRGSAQADNLRGDTGANIIEGGAGADILDGSAGVDTLSYENSSAGVTANLSIGSFLNGDAAGDTVSNFENIRGSAYDDTLTGDAGNNKFEGGAGSDVVSGLDGDDLLLFMYGDGMDTFDGGANYLDTIRLGSTNEAPNGTDWILVVDNGGTYTVDNANNHLDFDSADASGTLVYDDGSSLQFSNIERIEWT